MDKNMVDRLTVNLCENSVQDKLYHFILHMLYNQEGIDIRPIVVLCIGSDRYTGDSLGPLVGSYLQDKTNIAIYGSLDSPVHGGNLVETITMIKQVYLQPIIIAIDACLGKAMEIGNIEVWKGSLEAGIAVGNKLPSVGHISIIGVVNTGGQYGYMDLQSTPLSMVMKLSKAISIPLLEALNTLHDKKSQVLGMV